MIMSSLQASKLEIKSLLPIEKKNLQETVYTYQSKTEHTGQSFDTATKIMGEMLTLIAPHSETSDFKQYLEILRKKWMNSIIYFDELLLSFKTSIEEIVNGIEKFTGAP